MAFELDDLDPRNKKKTPLNLDDMNIEDLEEYVGALKAEIERVTAKIKAKQRQCCHRHRFDQRHWPRRRLGPVRIARG
jgi:uncharacterized small protein (DUF1192 family)